MCFKLPENVSNVGSTGGSAVGLHATEQGGLSWETVVIYGSVVLIATLSAKQEGIQGDSCRYS